MEKRFKDSPNKIEREIPIENECWLNKLPFYQCCCKCKYHIEDYSHPETDRKPIFHIRGYICLAPEITEGKGAFSGWPKHSIGCELYTPKENEKEDEK